MRLLYVLRHARHLSTIGLRALSTFRSDFAPGTEFYGPESAKKHEDLVDLLRKEYRRHGYREIMTPTLLRTSFLKKFGIEGLEENVIIGSENDEFVLKSSGRIPACIVFDSHPISHRFLPVRYVDFGVLHKQGSSKSFVRWNQDEASVFCKPIQIEDELRRILNTTIQILRFLRLEIVFQLSKGHFQPHLQRVLKDGGLKYETIDAADTILKGVVQAENGDYWSGTSVQIDEETPRVMDLHYYDEDCVKTAPILVSHTVVGPFHEFLRFQEQNQRLKHQG
ncbi:unnamed protein product [Bursaphelenchus xylophilus]|nr:unnamed protein product [Bursaphelenchus xylophilus]CAG9131212.1 unnamed protein product [Bursaphelenchus xylophilus]